MDEMYFTITGCNHYFGSGFMEKGMKVKLEKEPDNVYDKEAIQVKMKGMGKIVFVIDGGAICRITDVGRGYVVGNEGGGKLSAKRIKIVGTVRYL